MFPSAVILEIRRLLDEGELSRRAIAAKIGVSRGLVNNVANGQRGLRRHKSALARLSPEQLLGTPARCRHCGGLVYQPCLLCRARTYKWRVAQIRRSASLELVARTESRCVA